LFISFCFRDIFLFSDPPIHMVARARYPDLDRNLRLAGPPGKTTQRSPGIQKEVMRPLTTSIKCGDTRFSHYYLCPYLPLTAGQDPISISLLKFKQRAQPDLDAWIECAVQHLQPLNLDPDTIILRALRHDETTVRTEFPTALDLLGHTLAARLDCHYQPTHLLKSKTTLPNKHLTRHQRRNQLQDVYNIPNPITTIPQPPFLLIDDILTTGATMRALIHTLRQYYITSPIRAFTLARVDYHSPNRSLPAPITAHLTQLLHPSSSHPPP
jgi:predicted amidophosphoribosyltransferase